MTSEPTNLIRPSRVSPVPVILIIFLTPFISAIVAFICVSLEIWLDPENFVGEVDTLYEALQVDAGYIRWIVTAVFVFGFIAGMVAAACFTLWRAAGCCNPIKTKTDA